MPPIPNPNNGFVPAIGQIVRVVGGCHPWVKGKLCVVHSLYENNFESWAIYGDKPPSLVSTGGELGGLEPLSDSPNDWADLLAFLEQFQMVNKEV